MSPSPNHNLLPGAERGDACGPGEDTLRLIASLRAPEGLVDRVQAGLRAAPQAGRVLPWRGSIRPSGGWMHSSLARGAAAAAIVCVVAGGGWRIYSHVQPAPTAKVVVMPQRVGPGAGGLTPAGAVRIPHTLDGPTLSHPVANNQPNAVDKAPASSRATSAGATGKKKKVAAHSAVTPVP
jgi:hypothetical protein